MPVHTARITVRSAYAERFERRVSAHARASLEGEGGCHASNVYWDREDAARFLLFERYGDEHVLDAHHASAHFKDFCADVDDWVVERQWSFWSPASRKSKPKLCV